MCIYVLCGEDVYTVLIWALCFGLDFYVLISLLFAQNGTELEVDVTHLCFRAHI